MPAKSSSSMPAPPVKIQRGGSTQTPARPQPQPQRRRRRRKKRPHPLLLFLQGILRRLYFGLKTGFKLLLLVPVLVFMVAFSYNVDRSGLFQGELAPRRIVDLMLGVDSFFNMGVTGADVRDNMTSYYKMVSYGKTPKVLIWSVDPWVFYGSEAAFDYRADADLYNEFLTKVLNVPTDYEEPDQVELWRALADPAYFQGNVDYYFKNRGQTTVTDDDGNTIEFNPVEGDPYQQTTTIKRSDGSVLYDVAFRTQTADQIRSLAAEACMSFNSVHMEGFEELSDTQIQAFDSFIKYAQSQGTTVILILSPWHPYLYGYLLTEPDMHKGFFQVENWVRQYAADNNIPLYGSYDPECVDGLVELDFFDGLHCSGSGIEKFFPGVPQTLQDLENGTLPDPLAVHPRTSLETPGEEIPEGENADASAETADSTTTEEA